MKFIKRLFFLLAMMILLAGLGEGVYFYKTDPRLHFKKLTILDAHYVHQNQIEMACSPLLGKNIVELSLSRKTKQHFLQLFPEILDLHIAFQFPSTLILKLKEKKPVMLCISDTEKVEVSFDGTLLAHHPLQPSPVLAINPSANATENVKTALVPTDNFLSSLPKIEGLTPYTFKTKRLHPIITTKLNTLLAELAATLPKERLVIRLEHMWTCASMASDELTLVKSSDIPIKMGTLDTFHTQCQSLAVFLTDPVSQDSSKPIHYIDMRIPDKIIVGYE